MDETSGEIVAAAVTTNDFGDGQLLPQMLDQTDEHIAQVSADGAYDTRARYAAIDAREAQAAIPPRRGARIWRHGNSSDSLLAHDENLRCIRRMGRAAWERAAIIIVAWLKAAMFRIKTIFGDRVRTRSFSGQAAEMLIHCSALNRMTHLGMPDSYAM